MFRAAALAASLALTLLPMPALAQSEAQVPPGSAVAAENPDLFALFRAIGLYDVLEIMATEGIDYADDLEMDMFPGQGGPAWPAMVAQIYAVERLIGDFEAAFPAETFTEAELARLTDFFTSDRGQRIIAGEILARREIMDEDVEAAANQIYMDRVEAGDPRLDLLNAFIETNSLVDLNVSGALNSNFAFYRGLVDGGAFDVDLPEDMMLAEVWGQEPEIRSETTLWLYSYQLMAYDDLSDADLEAYIALSETSAGRALNRALFAAFDAMFEQVSYDLGAAAAVFIAGEET